MSKDHQDKPSELADEKRGTTEDNETILMALDQISQTIDVMNSVVGRLRQHVQERDFNEQADVLEAMSEGQTVH